MEAGSTFIARWEGLETFPYVPGAGSGITIGVGYDIGTVLEQEFRGDWAELATVTGQSGQVRLASGEPAVRQTRASLLGVKTDLEVPGAQQAQGQSLPALGLPDSKLFTPLDRLAQAARGKLSHEQALRYLPLVEDIAIPSALSLRVFRERSLPKFYDLMVRTMAGIGSLPTGIQVALLSVIYNRGTSRKGPLSEDDIFDSRWEMRELCTAVLFKDIVWIYWYLESMRRIWASKRDATSRGLVKRRDAELGLILPYVAADLQFEATLQRSPWSK